jgi:Saxitoxin biosynthesis operon protein SxtJ
MEARLDLHETLARDETVKGPSERRFGFTFAVVFLLVAAYSLFRGHAVWPALLALALVFLAVASLAPNWLKALNRLWLRLGLALHAIISPIVLVVLFFVVVTPVGVLARVAGKDFLRLTFDREASTYWMDRRPPGPTPMSMRNQF